jgi:hypothetical protein
MSGIVKVIISFYRKGQESPFERHRSRLPVDLVVHSTITQLRKHSIEFTGLKEQVRKFGLGSYALKLYRLDKANGAGGKLVTENVVINTDDQWKLEVLNLISDESTSELNGTYEGVLII